MAARAEKVASCLILDASVLINFLAVNAMAALALLPRYRLWITSHVRQEITGHYPQQVARLDAALASGHLAETRVTSMEGLALFVRLRANGRLGLGECAAIAAAAERNCLLAMDDRVAARIARRIAPAISIWTTQDLVVSLLQHGVLSVADADAWKLAWEQRHRFKLKIRSFEDLL